MKQFLFVLVCGSLWSTGLQAQVEQLATSGDGSILLFHSRFSLQSETDISPQGKIYRWQAGQWTRLAAAPDVDFPIGVQQDVFGPFLSADAKVVGWQILYGCGLCRTIVGPESSSAVSGVTLPTGFAFGTLQMSANGRYFTGDNYPFAGTKYLDAVTGVVSDVPVNVFARPVIRKVANDGTALLLLTQPNDPSQSSAPGALALWKPGSDPQPIYSENRAYDATISPTGGRVAFEAVVEGGPNDDQRTLVVLDTQTGQRFNVASLPPRDYRALFASFSQPVWDGSGTKLLYRSFDEKAQPTSLVVWDRGTQSSQIVLTNAEGFANAVISGDGRMVWAVTNNNRLLRLVLLAGTTDEILPPLGFLTFSLGGDAVAGSAVLLSGSGFTNGLTVLDGGAKLPLLGSEPAGLWVQIPWEDASSVRMVHTLTIFSSDIPFENVVKVPLAPQPLPDVATFVDPDTGTTLAKAAHEDFMSLVTPAHPARPGETVHVYLTGLGAVDQPVATGAPSPWRRWPIPSFQRLRAWRTVTIRCRYCKCLL